MKKQILLLAMMLLPMVAGTQGVVEIDGIYYELVSKIKEAIVNQKTSGKYIGSVDIPAQLHTTVQRDEQRKLCVPVL